MNSALRSLRKDPRYSIVAVATLAITIGGVGLMLTLIHSALLKPLPYPDPDKLVVLWEKDPRFPIARGRQVRTAYFVDWKTQNRSFESMALYRPFVYDVDVDANPVRAEVWSVSPSFFPILGAEVATGRGFTAEDERANSAPVVVLSHEFWQEQFNGDPTVLGKTITLSQRVIARIVGVLAPGFQAPLVGTMGAGAQAGLEPASTFPVIWQAYQPAAAELENRDRGAHTGIGRLKPGVSAEMALAELRGITQQLVIEYGDTNSNITPMVSTLIEEVSGAYKSVLWILLAAVFCVLGIGLGNLANLQMVRNSVRERELSIRAALGASRSSLVRQLMTETGLLVALGGLAGTITTALTIRILIPALPVGFPRLTEINVDETVLLYIALICVAAGLILGAAAALRVWQPHLLLESLKDTINSVTATRGRIRSRRVVIAAETALAFIILVAASLLLNSWWRLTTTPTGMDEANVVATSIMLPPKYRAREDQIGFFLKAVDAVSEYPAVEAAGLVTAPPLAGLEMLWPNVLPQEGINTQRVGVTLSLRAVTPDYFRVLRIPLLRGRFISASDTSTMEHVAVLNEAAATSLFQGEDPIGRKIASYGKSYTIVGVIADVKMRRLDTPPSPQIYASYLQEPAGSDLPVTMLVRTQKAEAGIISVIRSLITALDPDVRVSTSTMEEVRWLKTSSERFRTVLLMAFAATALFLTMLGIFGIVSYAVAQGTREIGIRMAIGADPVNVTILMIRQSIMPAIIGLIVGIVVSLWVSRLLKGFLYEIAPTDFTTYLTAALLFAFSVVLASYIPARRAAQIDPWTTLRHQ
ncbi:MAG: ABC transporter permease [Acidobacteria bacterium]|nr:ABC transporter permease [Acidobacteriota bacterium]